MAALQGTQICVKYIVQTTTLFRLSFLYKSLFFTRNRRGSSLLLSHDDEFVSVDLTKVFNILLTESSENLHFMGTELMGPLTGRSKLTDTLEIVLADVKLDAGGGEPAGTVQTVALVVMLANLQCNVGVQTESGDLITTKIYDSLFRNVLNFLRNSERFLFPPPGQPTSGSR